MGWISKFKYPQWALINFLVLALWGLVMRYMQVYALPGVNYQFIMHAHSHFAFAGWMFFSIALLIIHTVDGGKYSTAYKQVLIGALLSAYGMLICFSFQGYKALSIGMSTLFILVTYRFTYLVIKDVNLKVRLNDVSIKLLYAALGLLCFSSLGPVALGPIVAMGFRNTPFYQNTIYFYLHFQMNGFMLFAALGLFGSTYLTRLLNKEIKWWLYLFIFSTVPLFFIFTLWDKPGLWVCFIAFSSSGINLISWINLCMYFKQAARGFSLLVNLALIAITLKIVFQVLICIPAIGQWAFSNRNLIVGYIHLLTLGSITPLLLDQFIKKALVASSKNLSIINWVYITTVIIYLALLFMQPLLSLWLIAIPHYQAILLVCCIFFVIAAVSYFYQSFKVPSEGKYFASQV